MGSDWLQLIACALAIAYAGARLTLLADVIGEKTGMSGSWVGLLLLAAVTSLPELATGISAVTVAQAPNIAVGDVLGSTVFNLALLVLLDVLHRPDSIYSAASTGHILSAAFGTVLLGVVVRASCCNAKTSCPRSEPSAATPRFSSCCICWRCGVCSPTSSGKPTTEGRCAPSATRRSVCALASLRFGLFAGIVAVAGIWLPVVGARIADEMGWSRTFVGTLLIAGATSLPEVVVTLAALRLRALDMAIGGLLGATCSTS